MDTLQPLMQRMGEVIAGAGSIERAKTALVDWTPDAELTTPMASAIAQPGIVTDMAGQLMVHTQEIQQVALSRMSFAVDQPRSFLDLPWTDAIEQFQRLSVEHEIRNKEFIAWTEAYARRGAGATDLMVQRLKEKSFALLNRAFSEGLTQQWFVRELEAYADTLGVGPGNPAYLRAVFRTNTMTAYGAGKWRAISDPDVIADRPHWQYFTVGEFEARVRPMHRLLHGLVFEVGNSETDGLAPTNGYQCRCSAVSLGSMPRGAKVFRSPPNGYVGEPGFNQPPTAMIDQPLS